MKKIFNLLMIGSLSLFLISTTVSADINAGTPSTTSGGCAHPVKKKIIRKHKKNLNANHSATGKVCISCIGSQAQ